MRTALFVSLLLLPVAAGQTMYATDEWLSGTTANVDYAARGMAPAPGKAYAAFGQGATTYTTAFDGNFDKDYVAGEWTIQLFLSCDRPTAYRPTSTAESYRPTVSAALSVAGSAVGTVYGESTLRTCDGPADVWALELPITSSVAPGAGSPFRLDVNVWWSNPPPGDGQNGYFLVGGDQPSGLTGLVELVTAPERQVINTTLNGTFGPNFTQSTNATYQISFAAAEGQELLMQIEGENGTAAIAIIGNNGTLFTENGTVWNATQGLEAGSYQAIVNLTDFTGGIRVGLVTPAPEVSDGNQTSGPNGTAGPNGTDGPDPNATPDPSKGSPALAPVAFVATLAVMAIRRRRQ